MSKRLDRKAELVDLTLIISKMSCRSWLKQATPDDKEQQAYLLHAGVLPALLPALERLLDAAAETQIARTRLRLVPLLAEHLSTLARQQPADPVAALASMLADRSSTVEPRPENSQYHDSSCGDNSEDLSERRLLALYLRNSGPGARIASDTTTRLRLPLTALAKGGTNETTVSSSVRRSLNEDGLGNNDSGSIVMTPRSSFHLTPRLTERRTARYGNNAGTECDDARAIGDGTGLTKLSECTTELEVMLTLRRWRMDAYFDPSTAFFHIRAVEEPRPREREAAATSSSLQRSFTPRLGTPPTSVEVALSSSDFWRFAVTCGGSTRTATSTAASVSTGSKKASEDTQEAARLLLESAVLEPLGQQRGSRRAKGSGFMLKFQKPPSSGREDSTEEAPNSNSSHHHSTSVVWSKSSKRIGGRIYVVEVIVEPRGDVSVDRATFDQIQRYTSEEKMEECASQEYEKRHKSLVTHQSEAKENNESNVESAKEGAKRMEDKEGRINAGMEAEKKGTSATLPTQLPGEVKVLIRFQLYDPLSSTYLEASSLLIAARSLEERRIQVQSALRCLDVVTTPSGSAAILRLCTRHGTPGSTTTTSCRSSDRCTGVAWTMMLPEKPQFSRGLSSAAADVESSLIDPNHSPKLYSVEVQVSLTSPDSSLESNGRPRLLVQARPAPPPPAQSAPSSPPLPSTHEAVPAAASAPPTQLPLVLLLPLPRDLMLVGTEFADRSMAVLQDPKTTSTQNNFEPLHQLFQGLAIQFLDCNDNNTNSVVKQKREETGLRFSNDHDCQEMKRKEEHEHNESSRILHVQAWAMAQAALNERKWALWHPTADQPASAEVKLSQLSRRVAAARALDAAVGAVLTPEKDEPVLHPEIISSEMLLSDCDDDLNGELLRNKNADIDGSNTYNSLAEPKVNKRDLRLINAAPAKGVTSSICTGRNSTDSCSDDDDGSDDGGGSDSSGGAKSSRRHGKSFAAKIARDGKRRSLVELSTSSRRERNALWESKGELVFRRAQQLDGRHTIVSVHILRPAYNVNDLDAHNSAAAQCSSIEESKTSHRDVLGTTLQQSPFGSAGAVRISAHDPETCLDSEVTLSCWDVDSPVGLGSKDTTAQRRAAQFLCSRLQVGGRSGLTVFSFEADATALTLLASFLAIPRNQNTHRAPRDCVAVAIESLKCPLHWVTKILKNVVDAKNDKGVSFEDLIETMEWAWGSTEKTISAVVPIK